MSVLQGSLAPDFTLYDNRREAFRLTDYRGKQNVLLLFFPGAFTGVCTAELNAVSADLGDYGGEDGTQVVGISTDSPFVLAEYAKAHGFRFPLLSDHDAEVSARYGAKYDHDFTPMKLDRISKRAAFVIDRQGVVRHAEVLDNAGKLPDFEAVKQTLARLG